MPLKIAIVGYGQMGKQIESLAQAAGCQVTNIFDLDNPIKETGSYDFDVAIDFTFPDTVIKNVLLLARLKKNIVLGTTGWYQHASQVQEIVAQYKVGLVWGSNFSIGMQIFSRVISKAAELINPLDDYDVFMHELHHRRKKDSPSGTAVTLAQTILDKVNRKTEIETGRMDTEISPSTLHVSSTRGGEIAGTHTVYLDSLADTIELTHRARNRSGFASGSLVAAKWIAGKQGYYNFDNVMDSIWEGK